MAKVYAAARDPRTIDVADPRVVPLWLDVTDAVSVAEAAEAASDVSVLINNAGSSAAASVLDPDTSNLREQMETNLFGPLAMASAFADRIAAEVGCDRQRRVGARVAARRRQLRGDEGRDVERHGLHAARARARVAFRWSASTSGSSTPTWPSFADSPKSDPAEVIRQVLDGIESGADEVLADEMTREARAHLHKPIHERFGA